ncbi:MAG: glycosyltransferase [Arachnia sp.]
MTLRIGLVSMHTSPLELPGRADAGGMNVFTRALAEAIGTAGHSVEFLTRRSAAEQPDLVAVSQGVSLRYLDAGPPAPLPKSQIDAHIDEFSQGLGRHSYDVWHSHHWMSGCAALPVAKAQGVPHVMTYHSVAAHPNSPLRDGEPAESPARLAGELQCAAESDLVLAVSHYEAAVAIGRLNADPERVAIVRPGVDTLTFHPTDDPWAPPGVAPGYALFAARLQPLKGPDVAIRAVAQVPKAIRPDLVVAGEASPDFAEYATQLHELVAKLGMSEHVTFLPGQDRSDLARLMRHASVMVVPSHSETFGMVALEASASGTPVLAAAAGGLTESTCHERTGLLINGHDVNEWGRQLAGLIADPDRREAMGRAGRRRAEELTWPIVADRVLCHYERLQGIPA